jgi:hypothetical protein
LKRALSEEHITPSPILNSNPSQKPAEAGRKFRFDPEDGSNTFLRNTGFLKYKATALLTVTTISTRFRNCKNVNNEAPVIP